MSQWWFSKALSNVKCDLVLQKVSTHWILYGPYYPEISMCIMSVMKATTTEAESQNTLLSVNIGCGSVFKNQQPLKVQFL